MIGCFFIFLCVHTLLMAQGTSPTAARTQNTAFRTGAAARIITPPVGSVMGNSYGLAISEGVHDDLYAKALVFEKGSQKAVLVALDLISLPHALVTKTRELIALRMNIPATNVIMSATHAHAGPQMNPLFLELIGGSPKQKSDAYFAKLPEMIYETVKSAEENLQLVRVSVGTVQEHDVNFNRRFLMKDGSYMMHPGRLNPEIVRAVGPVDPELSIAYFESLDEKPVALLVNFALHPAIVGGKEFSADYPATLSSIIGEVMGKDMVTVFTNGTSGNVSHVDVSRPHSISGHAEAARVGAVLAGDVLKAIPSLRPVEINTLRTRSETVHLPVPQVTPDEINWAKETIAKFGKPEAPAFFDVVKAWRILDLVALEGGIKARHATTTTVPLVEGGGALVSEVQAIAMGNEVVLVGFPGDAFVELGLSIKLNSPFPYTIVSEQSGNGTTSYMPNRKAFSEGGYEVISARYSPGGGEILVGAVNRMLTDLFFNE